MSGKVVTMAQLLESARQGEALIMQVAEATAADVTALDMGKAAVGHTHTAADVGAAAANHTHTAASVGAAAASHTHTASQITGLPVSLPASDVYAWAKAASKPSYTASEVGAAASGHIHSASDITSGFLPIARGGTGNTSGYVTAGRKSGTTLGFNATAEGNNTTASKANSHAEGSDTTASGEASHAEGNNTTASGGASHAEGYGTKASGTYSHTEGDATTATGGASHAEGKRTKATWSASHAEGCDTTASGEASHAEGYGTEASASYQHACGKYNVKYTAETTRFIIGKGSSSARANCFRVTDTGTYAAGAYNASGADYAELFEWADGNPENEDRAGRFVTLTGDKLRLAASEDDYILGIVSGNPSIVGDVHDDQWAGMYLYDVFGRPLWEDVEVPDETMEEPDPENPGQTVTRVIIPAHTEHRQKLNPDYDGTQPYTARSQRPEWDAVGLMGKLVAVDDGTCQVDGYCTVREGGAATASGSRTRYRVMRRLDDSHVQVMVLP